MTVRQIKKTILQMIWEVPKERLPMKNVQAKIRKVPTSSSNKVPEKVEKEDLQEMETECMCPGLDNFENEEQMLLWGDGVEYGGVQCFRHCVNHTCHSKQAPRKHSYGRKCCILTTIMTLVMLLGIQLL